MSTTDPNSRTARRNDARALLDGRRRLLAALADLPPEARALIPADDELKQAIEMVAAMKHDSARRRIIRHHARRQPESVWPELEEALARLGALDPEALADTTDDETGAWMDRLMTEADAALADFVDAYPTVDRNRLRQLLRNARRRTGPAGQKARRALTEAVSRALRDAED